jgi:hypothetical protein
MNAQRLCANSVIPHFEACFKKKVKQICQSRARVNENEGLAFFSRRNPDCILPFFASILSQEGKRL